LFFNILNVVFNTAKKEFTHKYPGLLNALNNTFNNVEVKKDFLSLDDEVYLKKDFVLGHIPLQLVFHLEQNNRKFQKIQVEIDFDFYVLNKQEIKYKYDLNKKLDYYEFVSYYSPLSRYSVDKSVYVDYLNDLCIKNHILSKYKGEVLSDFEDTTDRGLSKMAASSDSWRVSENPNYFEEKIKNLRGKDRELQIRGIKDRQNRLESYREARDNIMLWHNNALKNNGTNYDALGKPQGVRKLNPDPYNFFANNSIISGDRFSFDYKNADFLDGYKHKSNFVLHIEIMNKKSVLYESYLLLDSNNMSEITLTDYDNIKNKLDGFLESFERSATHKNLSNNFNVESLVCELTGKNYLKSNLDNMTNSNDNNSVPNNSIEYMHSTLIPIRQMMCLLFSTGIGKFESHGYNLIHGNFLSPPDHALLLAAIKFAEEALWDSFAELLENVGVQSKYGKFLIDKWDKLIDESKEEELQKFLTHNNIQLIKFHDEPKDLPYDPE